MSSAFHSSVTTVRGGLAAIEASAALPVNSWSQWIRFSQPVSKGVT
jgi:hypothetical protein